MKYTEEENETIEQAKSNLLRGNDIESATLILEKVILDGMIIKCGRINIYKHYSELFYSSLFFYIDFLNKILYNISGE